MGRSATANLPLDRVRMADVARVAKVARSTAAQALFGSGGANVRVSVETADRIRCIAGEMNYQPDVLARGLRGSSTRSVGAVWEFVDPWSGDTAIGNAICARLQADGLATYQANHAGVRGLLAEFPGVVAVVPWAVPGVAFDQVIHDRDPGIAQAVDHFAAAGRRRPAIVVHGSDASDRRKVDVFRRRWRERGTGDHDQLCIDLGPVRMPRVPRYEAAMAGAFGGGGPVGVDAILCVNDVGAMTVARFLRRRGVRVPQDVAVVGLNDPEAMALFDPPLASIDRRQEEVVRAVCELVDRRIIDAATPPERRVVAMQFVWRESAGGPPAA